MAKLTIEDLLNSLQNPNDITLENTNVTWSRIGNKDSFEELELDESELENFLNEWINENEYQNL